MFISLLWVKLNKNEKKSNFLKNCPCGWKGFDVQGSQQ